MTWYAGDFVVLDGETEVVVLSVDDGLVKVLKADSTCQVVAAYRLTKISRERAMELWRLMIYGAP